MNFLDPKKNLGLKVPVLKNVLTEPKGIRTGDLFPVIEDLDRIQRYMHDKMGIGKIIDINDFVDLRFAQEACKGGSSISGTTEINQEAKVSTDILKRRQSDQAAKAMLGREGKYLTFTLGSEEFGIEILKIKEIIGMMPITGLPNTSYYMKGVVNLREKVIPVIDLRLKFGLEEKKYNDRTCIIILELIRKTGSYLIGIVVDSVSEVLSIKSDEIDDPPDFGNSIKTDYILGMAKTDGNVKILLEIEEVLRSKSKREFKHELAA